MRTLSSPHRKRFTSSASCSSSTRRFASTASLAWCKFSRTPPCASCGFSYVTSPLGFHNQWAYPWLVPRALYPTADLACRSAWAGLLGCAHGQERFLEQQELGLVCGQEELALSRGVLVEDIGLSGSNDNEGTVTMPRHGMSGAMVVRTASPALCPIQYPIGCRRAVLTAAPGRLPYDPFGRIWVAPT